MGTSHSIPEFTAKIRGLPSQLAAAEKPAAVAGGLVAQRIFTVTKDVMGAGGPRGVTVKNTATQSNGHPAQRVKFGPNPGWVAILNSRTKPHDIYPRKFAGTRGRGVRARRGAGLMAMFGVQAHRGGGLVLGGNVRSMVHHPGTKGKHFVEAAQAAAPRPVIAAMHKVVTAELAKGLMR